MIPIPYFPRRILKTSISAGEIIDALESRGYGENTCIIFSADHGERLCDHRLPVKHVAYEPSWRVPLIVSGPGLPEGNHSDALIELMDVGETICDLTGISSPPNIDARSFLPVLTGSQTGHRDYVLTIERPYQAMRTREWKYIDTYNDWNELYNMQDDPQELRNRVHEEPETAKELAGTMRDGFAAGGILRL
jgi:arylsulfatase